MSAQARQLRENDIKIYPPTFEELVYERTEDNQVGERLDNKLKGMRNEMTRMNENLEEIKDVGNYTVSEIAIGKVGNDVLYRRCYLGEGVSKTSTFYVDENFISEDIKFLKSITASTLSDGEWNDNVFALVGTKQYRASARVDSGGVRLLIDNLTVTKYMITIEYTKNLLEKYEIFSNEFKNGHSLGNSVAASGYSNSGGFNLENGYLVGVCPTTQGYTRGNFIDGNIDFTNHSSLSLTLLDTNNAVVETINLDISDISGTNYISFYLFKGSVNTRFYLDVISAKGTYLNSNVVKNSFVDVTAGETYKIGVIKLI